MYRRVNNSGYVVAGISGIVMVMSIFTWLMYGIANRIDQMAMTMVELGKDVRTMTEVQKVMVKDIGIMTQSVHSVSQNMALITGNTSRINASMSRMSYDVGRTSSMFSSPMSYFWNTGP